MVRVSGFTIIKNAISHDFPVEASIRSILPVCDEVIVNVGPSDDGTLDLIKSIDDPKIKIIEGVWDVSRQNWMLSDETLRAMRACSHPWGIYIQADEVLHERGGPGTRGHDGGGGRRSPRRGAAGQVPALLRRLRHHRHEPPLVSPRNPRAAARSRPRPPPLQGRAGLPGRARTTGRRAPGSPTPKCSTTAGRARRRRSAPRSSPTGPSIPGRPSAKPSGRCFPGFPA